MGHATRRATAMFQTFAVEVLNSFWLVVDDVEEHVMLMMRCISISVKSEKETFFHHV